MEHTAMSTLNSTRTPDEIRLNFFVGDWHNIGQVYPGPFGPGGASTGTTSYRWELGGKWLMYTSRLTLPGLGDYEVQGGVTYNPKSQQYDAYAVNNLGVLLAYHGFWENDSRLVFNLTYPQGRSRVVYIKLADGRIQMNSENSNDGETYQAYFETTLSRDES
jgi:hypothetical protein